MSFWSRTAGWRALLWVAALLCLPPAQAASSGSQEHAHIEVELVAEYRQAVPGGTLPIALRLLPQAGWHTYWRNPGDSGLETRIRWELPSGVQAGDIQWPTPQRLPVEHLVNYGMEGETWLISDLQLPADLPLDRPLEIHASVAWLVCEIACIPGFADFQLSLPVVARDAEPALEHVDGFAAARQRQPVPAPWPARFSSEGGMLRLTLEPPPALREGMERVYFFPASAELVDHSKPQALERGSDHLTLSQALGPLYREPPERLAGVLRVETGQGVQGFELVATPLSMVVQETAGAMPGLVLTLGLALLGGLLLNLMPCVFPVLSLKALSLAQGAGQARRTQALHGISYTLGVLASFGLVAGLLLFLRAGGAAIGWGFQLQSPLFIGLLAMLMFALALSLSGLIDFGTRLMGIGQQLTVRGGYRGSFFTGVLATLVASPCTAPFMGVALGIAVLQPPFIALIIFLTLGLGMASPFLLLGLLPVLGRWLPRPGAWMETFKQAMAFPLYLTVVWLLWVLGRQAGVDAMAAVALGLVALALALWLWGRAPGRHPWLRHGVAGVLVVLALASLRLPGELAAPDTRAGMHAPGEAFSAERLAALRAEGRVVFVNMTADWCITCKVNEQLALNTGTVQRAIAEHEVAYLQGDWTRHDPAITAYLARYGRNGVPHYVVYRPGQDGRVLPQVLTAGLVVEALAGH